MVSVCKCLWFLEKIKVSQLFFNVRFAISWIKYFMIVDLFFYFCMPKSLNFGFKQSFLQ